MGPDTILRPVLAIEAELDLLADPTQRARHGAARKRLAHAVRALPSGALDDAGAERLARRWIGEPPAGVAATRAPLAEVGATYWLLDVDDPHGLVIRLRLEALPARTAPWSEKDFWPTGAPHRDAVDAVSRAWERAAAWLGVPVLDPPFGWHRLAWCEERGAELRIRGRSHTAPLFAMLVSAKLGVALPADVAVTGDLTSDGRVHLDSEAREGLRAKHRALARERACVRRMLVPPGFDGLDMVGGPELVAVEDVDSLCRALSLPRPQPGQVVVSGRIAWRHAVDAAEAAAVARTMSAGVMMGRLRALWRSDPWTGTAEPAPWAIRRARVLIATRLCEYETHSATQDEAVTYSAALDALLADPELRGAAAARARNVQASLEIDRRQYARARRLAAEALRLAREAGDREEEARTLGTVGRVDAHALHPEEALAALDEALAVQSTVMPWETNIVRTYRADALSRLGQHDEALAALDEADLENGSLDVEEGWRRHNAAFLAYARTKALLGADRPEEAWDSALRCEAAIRESGLPAVWPMAGLLARIVDIAYQLGRVSEAERALERLRLLDPAGRTRVVGLMCARAEAGRLARECDEGGHPSDLEVVRALLEDCERADEDGAVRAAAAGVRSAWQGGELEALAPALRRLRDAEIY